MIIIRCIESLHGSRRHIFNVLYYLYEKSSKKIPELKVLFDELKEVYEIDGKGVKPIQATVTRWVDHKLKVMLRLVSAFRLYTQHRQNVIADTSKKCDHATVKGKYDKLVHASVLAQSSLLIDILESAQNLSLKMQKNNLSIIDVVDAVEKTKTKYLCLLKKLTEEKNFTFTAFLAFKKIVKD